MSSNLPPGCRDSDIPGNRPEDEAFDRFLETDEYNAVADKSEEIVEATFREWYKKLRRESKCQQRWQV